MTSVDTSCFPVPRLAALERAEGGGEEEEEEDQGEEEMGNPFRPIEVGALLQPALHLRV